MKIVIDGRMLGWTGVGRYTYELLKNLEALDQANQYLVLVQSQDMGRWNPQAANFKAVVSDIPPYSLAEQIKLPAVLQKLNPDLVHFPAPNIPVAYTGKHVTTVHDLTLVDYQNIRGSWLMYQIKYWAFRLVVWRAIKSSEKVITDTAFVKKQIEQRYRRHDQDVLAIHLGSAEFNTAGDSEPPVKAPYILYVGNAYPFKNLDALVGAFALAVKKVPSLKLALVGPSDTFYDQLTDRVRKQGLSEAVVFLGRVKDEQLTALYKNASLYVFPSLSEGFGLPGLEAMSHGLPVLAANASCLPEIYGGAAVYFDPRDINDLASKITDLLSHPKKLDELRQAGYEQAKKYSWRQMAEETLLAYNSCVNSKA